jgi:hypothetical protein
MQQLHTKLQKSVVGHAISFASFTFVFTDLVSVYMYMIGILKRLDFTGTGHYTTSIGTERTVGVHP